MEPHGNLLIAFNKAFSAAQRASRAATNAKRKARKAETAIEKADAKEAEDIAECAYEEFFTLRTTLIEALNVVARAEKES